jgi:hypothetical protein
VRPPPCSTVPQSYRVGPEEDFRGANDLTGG